MNNKPTLSERLKRLGFTRQARIWEKMSTPPIDNAHVAHGCELFGNPKPKKYWGIEEMKNSLFVGPLRANSSKLAEIVYGVELIGLKPEAREKAIAQARFVVKAVNEMIHKNNLINDNLNEIVD